MSKPLLMRGAIGDLVKELQGKLANLGLLHKSEIDGIFGGMTEAAVRKFQQATSLRPDGSVGIKTWGKLATTDSLGLVTVAVPKFNWTLDNIQQGSAIVPNGSFTWAEATRGGSRMPPDQETLEGIIRIAFLAQEARNFIDKPFTITSWYRDAETNYLVGGVEDSRHINGDAIDFWVNGLSGDTVYALLDPWWSGGLGRYTKFPDLCHIDARNYRARWFN